jgi:hypothetical protein
LPPSSKKNLESHFTTKKIKSYDAEDMKALYQTILTLCKLIGVTEAPDQDVMILLIDHLKEHHMDFSREEIVRAFSLATAGKLGFDFVHYNRVTPQIISHVLNKYKQKLNKDIIEFRKVEKKELPEKRISKEERIKINVDTSVTMYEEYIVRKDSNNGHIEVYDLMGITFKFLEGIGVINISNDEKQKIKNKALEEVIKRAKLRNNEFDKNAVKRLLEEVTEGKYNEVISESRRMALKIFFDEMIDLEMTSNDFRELINSKLQK